MCCALCDLHRILETYLRAAATQVVSVVLPQVLQSDLLWRKNKGICIIISFFYFYAIFWLAVKNMYNPNLGQCTWFSFFYPHVWINQTLWATLNLSQIQSRLRNEYHSFPLIYHLTVSVSQWYVEGFTDWIAVKIGHVPFFGQTSLILYYLSMLKAIKHCKSRVCCKNHLHR